MRRIVIIIIIIIIGIIIIIVIIIIGGQDALLATESSCCGRGALLDPRRPHRLLGGPVLLATAEDLRRRRRQKQNRKATETDSVAKQTPGPAGARPHGKNCSGAASGGAPGAPRPLGSAVFPMGTGAGWVRNPFCNGIRFRRLLVLCRFQEILISEFLEMSNTRLVKFW